MALDIPPRISVGAAALACLLFGAWAVSADASIYRVTGTGFVTDTGHPTHPGDFGTYNLTARVTIDPELGEAVIALETTAADGKGKTDTDRYHVRRGRIFQVDDKGAETLPSSFGDVSPATVAALHPALVLNALRERPECVRRVEGGLVFAWNDELWTLDVDSGSQPDRVTALRFDLANYVLGDQSQEVRYEGWPRDSSATSPGRVVVHALGREVLRIDFTTTEKADSVGIAAGDRKHDRQWVANPAEIVPREIAPHLFSIDLVSLNMRVFVAEFKDYLMVFEGAWDPRNSDPIAARIRDHFRKPVRYFAFSHIHSQYIAGTRSYVHEGATVLVPPTTAPLIETMVREGRRLRPDALAAEPRPLRMETVPKRRRIEDRTNAVEVHNVESGHTDEYLIVYFPRQKVLLTGDLLFYRPGQKLSDRSMKLCENVRKLGLDVDTYVATWPLDGYGTKNVVTADEVRAAGAP
jgi:glyoxylase-like metal-dependent hydrolase (beta-lactamase superfamily II)